MTTCTNAEYTFPRRKIAGIRSIFEGVSTEKFAVVRRDLAEEFRGAKLFLLDSSHYFLEDCGFGSWGCEMVIIDTETLDIINVACKGTWANHGNNRGGITYTSVATEVTIDRNVELAWDDEQRLLADYTAAVA